LEMTGSVTVPSLYDPRGYLYTRAAIEEGREHLLTRRDIPLDMPNVLSTHSPIGHYRHVRPPAALCIHRETDGLFQSEPERAKMDQ